MSRTYDLLAFQHPPQPGEQLAEQTIFVAGASAYACTGIQKLAQRVLLELLTEQGSIPYLPERGTGLITAFRRGEVRTETDAFMTFGFAAARATRNIQGDETTSDPDDERLTEISLQRVVLTPSLVKLYVQVTTLAGTRRTFEMPVVSI